MDPLNLLGWAGSALLVYSVLQSRMLRLRLLNLAASAVLMVFNGLIEVWPMAVVNAVLVVINVVHLWHMARDRRRGRAFGWINAHVDEPYVRWLLDREGSEIAGFWPRLGHLTAAGDPLCFLMVHDRSTIGVVIANRTGPATADLLVDYVVPEYRDYTPGRFVYSDDGPFAAAGITMVRSTGDGDAAYLQRSGFVPDGANLVRQCG